jgi:exodeoxyribonuclease V alpha subunit
MENIRKLKEAGFFGSLDVQMAGLVSRMDPQAEGGLLVACALASRAISRGHACVDLGQYAGRSWAEVLRSMSTGREEDATGGRDDQDAGGNPGDLGQLPDIGRWKDSLKPPAVGDGSETEEKRTLFVLKDDRLYLRRYWDYERKVEAALKRMNAASGIKADGTKLERYFSEPGSVEQKAAAKKVIETRLSLLSGGPGTGKTYTLARAVAVLAEMSHGNGATLTVHLVAPTGKAAVRMVESVKEAKRKLSETGFGRAVVEAIPEKASTIHRLLETEYRSPYFKRGARNPLAADMVIVDEASMVDLPLMAKLLDALPEKCALMLVGDIDQLASVEPGRVYGDVCRAAEPGGPLAGCLGRLTRSWRFPENSAIGRISRLVNAGRDEEAWKALQASSEDRALKVLDSPTLHEEKGAFRDLVEGEMGAFLRAKEPAEALAAGSNFRILCALRKGPYGVQRMNRRVEKILSGKGLEPGAKFYDHQLIMVKVNTPSLGLYNGDVGVVLARPRDEERKGYLAWFPDAEKGARSVPVSLLPDHETAFAMTVHKAQGSEFPCVALILPDGEPSPILTRELLYTGMTRVRIDEEKKTGKLVMWCTEAGFRKAVRSRTDRATGLFAGQARRES